MRTVLLKDSFTFQTVPFLVRVEEREMYIHPQKEEIRGVNVRDHPTGLGKTPRGWTVCECRVAKLRPDYPYTIEQEWPENVDTHFHVYEPLEVPKKSRGLIFSRYTTVDREPERDAQEMAEDVVEKMKTAYEQRDRVETFSRDALDD